jgi:hypothetical protein
VSSWLYNEQAFDPELANEFYGFIYLITDTETSRKYIGRKFFSKAATRVVKGKRRKIRKPSDWEDYFGSSDELLTLVEEYGKDRFKREIIRLCKTLGETKYEETKELFLRDVLKARLPTGVFAYINSNIAMKYTRKNIGTIE